MGLHLRCYLQLIRRTPGAITGDERVPGCIARMMESLLLNGALELVKRQAELQTGPRQSGGIRISDERDLYAPRDRLRHYPRGVTAILQTAALDTSSSTKG